MDGSFSAVKKLFEAALELPRDERRAFVAAAGAASEVQAEVLSLLDHADASEGSWLDSTALDRSGQRLGAWRLLRSVGSGGMGDVYEAERADGAFVGRAAVKVLKRGLDSASVLERFARERSSLARLNHPHIARLFDAGSTADGLPYFVMEFVDGEPIDEAARDFDLGPRLRLFLQLADAVVHAHRNLLVHRDLKPGNVLVDRAGSVKLLDFGIAKAIEADDAATTAAPQRPFTPNYASPEQVRGDAVGTATDIYSLGVLLYQLLTGVRPTGRRATTPAEAARSVLEEEPTRPSGLPHDAVADPRWLQTRRRLQGDLDNILLKALEKSVERRYASVDALADDIRRHLAGLPVSAHAASPAYLLRKLIARHRVAAGAALVALLSLVGGTAVALWQARVADAQRVLAERRFDDVRRFARTMLFDVDQALRDGPTAGREKLVQTALAYLDRLSSERVDDDALARDLAEGYERIGDIQGSAQQSNLGRPDDAARSYDKARALRVRLAERAPGDLANVAGLLSLHERLGDSARAGGGLSAAARHYEAAVAHATTLAQARRDDPVAQVKRIESARYLSSIYYWPGNRSLGDHGRAWALLAPLPAQMEALQRRFPDALVVPEGHGSLLNQVFDFQRQSGDFDAALATQRRALQIAEQLVAAKPDHPGWKRWLALAHGRLGDALIDHGDFDAGVAAWQRSIALREASVRADPDNERAWRNLANGYGPLAEHYALAERLRDALPWYRKEHALLADAVQRFPQVAALKSRRLDAAHDLALHETLVGDRAEGLRRLQALHAEHGEAGGDDDAVRRLLVRAHGLLRGWGRGGAALAEPALAASALVAPALAAAEQLRERAAAEPFNAELARDAARAAVVLGEALFDLRDGRGCALVRQGHDSLRSLQRERRLGRSMAPLLRRAQAAAARCAA